MRVFSIVNSKGIEFNLTDNVNNVLFAEVGGLGIERDDSYRAVGNRYVRVSKVASLGSITGTIYFYGEKPYDQYRKFVDFAAVEPLYLKYTPTEDGYTYNIIVNMPKIDKTEIDKDTGALKCSVDFRRVSLYYREVSLITQGRNNNDRYAFAFKGGRNSDSIVWDAHKTNKFRSSTNMNVVVDSDSYDDSPCKLIIDGPIVNPSWNHYVDGVLTTTGKVKCTVPTGYKLVIDTINEFTSILIYDSNLKDVYMDVYQLSDFSTQRFIYLKHGKNSIQVSSESADIVSVRVDARLSYVTV